MLFQGQVTYWECWTKAIASLELVVKDFGYRYQRLLINQSWSIKYGSPCPYFDMRLRII